jgi:hypothetical protein
MTTFTMRYIKGHFVVTGPDVPPMQFKSRAEARDWCKAHYPGSPVAKIGPRWGRAPSKSQRPPVANVACPSFLRRAIGTTALYVVGVPMIVLGMLLVLTIVAVDEVERRFTKPPTTQGQP